MQISEPHCGRKLIRGAPLGASLLLMYACIWEELKEPYDGRCEAPVPPEVIAR